MVNLSADKRYICSGCTACAERCPVNCITMKRDKMGFMYPDVDETKCIHCDICDKVCAEMRSKYSENNADIEAYAIVGNDDGVRKVSSSGGLFWIIAKRIIDENGVVFGAAFSDDFHRVRHIAVDTVDNLSKLQGSKYVQSDINSSFSEVKMYLEQGKKVLFSGTPCQTSGLSAFLAKDYENLFLVDIVCHGVPSPNVWDEYIGNLEQKYHGKATRVSFRDKRYGWNNYVLSVEFDNGKEYVKNREDDLFMRGFLHDYYLRPSCYNCAHKGLGRVSDITLGDLWGAEKICPELNDNKGTSLVLASSPKGKAMLQEVALDIKCSAVDLSEAVKFNPAIVKSAGDCAERAKFEQEFGAQSTNQLLNKFCSRPLYKRVAKKLKSFLK